MPKFYQVCPVDPVNGACPTVMEWVEVPITVSADVFQDIYFPAIVVVLLTAYGWKLLRRMFFNR